MNQLINDLEHVKEIVAGIDTATADNPFSVTVRSHPKWGDKMVMISVRFPLKERDLDTGIDVLVYNRPLVNLPASSDLISDCVSKHILTAWRMRLMLNVKDFCVVGLWID